MILHLSIKSFLHDRLYQTKSSLVFFVLWGLSPLFQQLHHQLAKIRIHHLVKKHHNATYVLEKDNLFLLRKDCKKFFLIQDPSAYQWITSDKVEAALSCHFSVFELNDPEQSSSEYCGNLS